MVKVTQAGCYFTSSVSMATEIYVHGVGGGGFWFLVCLGGFFSFLYLFLRDGAPALCSDFKVV